MDGLLSPMAPHSMLMIIFPVVEFVVHLVMRAVFSM